MEGTVTNREKHPHRPIGQIDKAEFSAVPTRARSPHLVGSFVKSLRNDVSGRTSEPEYGTHAFILRLDLPATSSNVERIRERVRLLNRRLAASGTPLRLRMV
jgi:hypothetical protein